MFMLLPTLSFDFVIVIVFNKWLIYLEFLAILCYVVNEINTLAKVVQMCIQIRATSATAIGIICNNERALIIIDVKCKLNKPLILIHKWQWIKCKNIKKCLYIHLDSMKSISESQLIFAVPIINL